MSCRHVDPINNPNCSSFQTPEEQVENAKKAILNLKTRFKINDTPDNSNFEIMRVQEVGPYLVLEVKYESCENCSYEGQKVMVLPGKTVDALKWRVIDPHFRDSNEDKDRDRKKAPSPIARFPATAEGWSDATQYASSKSLNKSNVRTK